MPSTEPTRRSRILWFVAIYAVSLLAFTAFVYGFRQIVPH